MYVQQFENKLLTKTFKNELYYVGYFRIYEFDV